MKVKRTKIIKRLKKAVLLTLGLVTALVALQVPKVEARPWSDYYVRRTLTVLSKNPFDRKYAVYRDDNGALIEEGNFTNASVQARKDQGVRHNPPFSEYISLGGWYYNSTYGSMAFDITIEVFCAQITPYLIMDIGSWPGHTASTNLEYVSGGTQGGEFSKPFNDKDYGQSMMLECGCNLNANVVRVNWRDNRYNVCYYDSQNLSYPTGCYPSAGNYYFTYNYTQTFSVRSDGPSKLGYHFTNWKRKSKGSDGVIRETGLSYARGSGGHSQWNSIDNGDEYLYPDWLANTYTVKYDPNGGTGSFPDQTATYDKPGVTPKAPDRPGYTFDGWKDVSPTGETYGEESPYINLTPVDGGVVELEAQWTPNNIDVLFDKNLGNAPEADSFTITYTYDSAVTMPEAPEREGYTFLFWQIYSGSDTKTNSTVTNNNGEGATTYKAGEEVEHFDFATHGQIKMVAIWEHSHESLEARGGKSRFY